MSKRKTRKLIEQEKISLQENDSSFKMNSLLSKHSDLFDCESEGDDIPSTMVEEWCGKSRTVKQRKETKPARISKKEQFKLHSEAQRVVRGEHHIILYVVYNHIYHNRIQHLFAKVSAKSKNH